MNTRLHLTFIVFLCLLLLTGTASAAEGIELGEPVEFSGACYDYSTPIMVYVSGPTVTIEMNSGITSESFDYFHVTHFSVYSTTVGTIPIRDFSELESSFLEDPVIYDELQFTAEEPGIHTAYIFGYLNMEQEEKWCAQKLYLTFEVTDLNAEITLDPENPEIIIFSNDVLGNEIENKVIKDMNKDVRIIEGEPELDLSASLSQIVSVSQPFSYLQQGYEISLVLDNIKTLDGLGYNFLFSNFRDEIFDDFSKTNFIYNIQGTSLRSFVWYQDSSSIRYVGESQYKPEVTIKNSESSSFCFNYFFICPGHDDLFRFADEVILSWWYSDALNTATENNIILDYGECLLSPGWQVFANNEYLYNSAYLLSDYVISSVDSAPEESELPEIPEPELIDLVFSHAVTFDRPNSLRQFFTSNQLNTLEIYPIHVPETVGVEEEIEIIIPVLPDTTFKSAAIPILFYYEGTTLVELSVADSGLLSIPQSQNLQTPALNSLQFPRSLTGILNERDAGNLIVETQPLESVSSILSENTDLISEGTPIYAVISIDFSNPSVKERINKALKDGNSKVNLTFSVPARDSFGNPILPDELSIYHIIDNGNAGQSIEKLQIISVSDINEYGLYGVTAATSGFSPFIVASVDDSFNPSPSIEYASSGSSFGQIVTSEDEDLNLSENTSISTVREPNPLTAPIIQTVQKIKGYMSLFSILVVLIAGLFVWDYIRRSV